MIRNLFSIFDPSTCIHTEELGWIATRLGLVIIPYSYWVASSRYLSLFHTLELIIFKEMKALLGDSKSMISLAFISIFFIVFMVNRVGLLPWVFTVSSHLVFSLTLVLPLWIAYFLWGWVKNTVHSLAHLVPLGTPVALISFIVLIESIRRLIRPLTLSIRLAANIIAGHLLLALMRGAIRVLSPISMVLVVLLQILLILLEAAVAIIQAYVITVLSALYIREV